MKKENILKERSKYNASITYYRDLHNIEEQNFNKGMAKGIAKGKIETKLEIAKKLKKMNLPIENIIDATGLTVDEIKAIE